ncbi:hypothetical protein [Adlercreutzia sp. DFI.6.23]|nr:hypothetical protein [Adlercreutzia sp. DFI.6.23]
MDIEGGALTLNVSDEELARRRAAWEPRRPSTMRACWPSTRNW